jgi:hypothetical protein
VIPVRKRVILSFEDMPLSVRKIDVPGARRVLRIGPVIRAILYVIIIQIIADQDEIAPSIGIKVARSKSDGLPASRHVRGYL